MSSYIKEVQSLIDEGLNEEITLALYKCMTDELHMVCGGAGKEEFRARVAELRKNERQYYHEVIDSVCNRYPFPIELSWRNFKYEPSRVGWCDICGDFFYDASRNGKSLSCRDHVNEYRNRVRAGGDILFPISIRRRQEFLYDPQPGQGDIVGNAILNSVEMQAQANYRNKI